MGGRGDLCNWTGIIVPTDVDDVAEGGGEIDEVVYLRWSDVIFLEETTSFQGPKGKSE